MVNETKMTNMIKVTRKTTMMTKWTTVTKRKLQPIYAFSRQMAACFNRKVLDAPAMCEMLDISVWKFGQSPKVYNSYEDFLYTQVLN